MEATDTKSEGSVKFDKNFEEDEENNDGENYLSITISLIVYRALRHR